MNPRKLGIVGALAGMAALGTISYANSANWVAVDGRDCKVWNEADAIGALKWTGDCVDGLGEGPGVLTYRTEDGSIGRREGVMSAGRFQDADT